MLTFRTFPFNAMYLMVIGVDLYVIPFLVTVEDVLAITEIVVVVAEVHVVVLLRLRSHFLQLTSA